MKTKIIMLLIALFSFAGISNVNAETVKAVTKAKHTTIRTTVNKGQNTLRVYQFGPRHRMHRHRMHERRMRGMRRHHREHVYRHYRHRRHY